MPVCNSQRKGSEDFLSKSSGSDADVRSQVKIAVERACWCYKMPDPWEPVCRKPDTCHSSEAGAGRRSRHGAHYRCSHERHRIRNYYSACLPESAKGGPLRPVRTGDEIRLSVRERRIDAMVSEQDLENRRREARPVRGAARGYAKLYADSVLGPEFGCDFDFLRKDSVRIER